MTNGASAFSGARETLLKSKSRITTEKVGAASGHLDPIHPGEILEEEFMRPLGFSANALARRIDVPVTRISEIVRGKRGITADTAVRLARLFRTSPDLWMGLQAEYDLRTAWRDLSPGVLDRIVPLEKTSRGYGERSSAPSEVAEDVEVYGASPAIRPRDRDRRRQRKATTKRPGDR
jgi:addiction module HigA family antidote